MGMRLRTVSRRRKIRGCVAGENFLLPPKRTKTIRCRELPAWVIKALTASGDERVRVAAKRYRVAKPSEISRDRGFALLRALHGWRCLSIMSAAAWSICSTGKMRRAKQEALVKLKNADLKK